MNQYFTNNPNLKSQEITIKYTYNNHDYIFLSDNGVFSKNKIDYGSRVLVETYLKNKKDIKNFLDVGCGYGFISIVLANELKINAMGVDVNERAIKLAQINSLKNKVKGDYLVSDVYSNVKQTFDLIITNPPIRAGKQVVLKILEEAHNYLNKDGELWFAIRKDQGANSIKKALENLYKITLVEKNKGFYIFLAKNN